MNKRIRLQDIGLLFAAAAVVYGFGAVYWPAGWIAAGLIVAVGCLSIDKATERRK